VVHDVLQDHESLQPQQVGQIAGLVSMQRSQGAAVHVEAGHLLGQLLGHDVHGDVRPGVDHVRQRAEPPLGQQERPGSVASLQRSADDLLPLGDEESPLGLQVLAQGRVAESDVVVEPGVAGVGDLDDLVLGLPLGHPTILTQLPPRLNTMRKSRTLHS